MTSKVTRSHSANILEDETGKFFCIKLPLAEAIVYCKLYVFCISRAASQLNFC